LQKKKKKKKKKEKKACVFAQKQIAQVTKILSFIEQWFSKMNKSLQDLSFQLMGCFEVYPSACWVSFQNINVGQLI
jgi:hypothetical protein